MKFLTNLKSHSFFNCILKSGLLAVIFLSTFCLSACSKPANCLKKDISTEILTGDTTLPEDNKKDDKHISASPYAQDLIVPSHIDIDINETQCKITAVVLPKNCTSIVKFAIVNGQNVIEIIENKIIPKLVGTATINATINCSQFSTICKTISVTVMDLSATLPTEPTVPPETGETTPPTEPTVPPETGETTPPTEPTVPPTEPIVQKPILSIKEISSGTIIDGNMIKICYNEIVNYGGAFNLVIATTSNDENKVECTIKENPLNVVDILSNHNCVISLLINKIGTATISVCLPSDSTNVFEIKLIIE